MKQEPGKSEVRYCDGMTPVLIGDHVEVRGLVLSFLKKTGRVIYVPGISKVNPELEYDGLTEVGIDYDDGTRTATLVDPDTGCLQKIVTFLKRADGEVHELQPGDSFDE